PTSSFSPPVRLTQPVDAGLHFTVPPTYTPGIGHPGLGFESNEETRGGAHDNRVRRAYSDAVVIVDFATSNAFNHVNIRGVCPRKKFEGLPCNSGAAGTKPLWYTFGRAC